MLGECDRHCMNVVMNKPLDVLHDKGDPTLGCVRLPTGAGFDYGGLVGGGVELGQVLLTWDGQRNVLEVLQSHGHLPNTEVTDVRLRHSNTVAASCGLNASWCCVCVCVWGGCTVGLRTTDPVTGEALNGADNGPVEHV